MSLKKSIAQTFGEASLTYDANAFVQRFCANHVCALAKKAWDDVSKTCFPQIILDVGSGTGFVPKNLQKVWPDAFFILNDVSYLMLEQAAKKTKNSSLLHGDIEKCRIPLVDMVIANLSLQWVSDLPLTLEKLTETCDILLFSTLLQGSFYTWQKRLAVHGIYHATHPYPNSYALRRHLYALGRPFFFNSKTFSLAFPSPYHALQHLKKTGVCVPHGYVPAAKFVRFLKMDKRPIILEYFVCFVVVIKDSCASLLLESIQM